MASWGPAVKANGSLHAVQGAAEVPLWLQRAGALLMGLLPLLRSCYCLSIATSHEGPQQVSQMNFRKSLATSGSLNPFM